MQQSWIQQVITLRQLSRSTRLVGIAVTITLVMVSGPEMTVQALPSIAKTTVAQTRAEIEPTDLLAEATRLYHQAHEQQQPSLYIQAALLGRQALLEQMQNLDENHSDRIESLEFLDELYKQMEQVPPSLPAIDQLKLRIAEELDRQLQTVRLRTDQDEQAIQLTEKLLSLYQEILGQNHLRTIRYQLSLAWLYKYHNDDEQAENLFRNALQTCRDSLNLIESHSCIQGSLDGLQHLYIDQVRYSEAEILLKNALERHQLQLGQNHEDLIKILRNLSLVYSYHNQPVRAEEILLKIVEYYRSKLREDDSPKDFQGLDRALSSLINFYIGEGKYQAAETLFRERLEINQQHVKAIERRIAQSDANSPEGISLRYHHLYASQEILASMESLVRLYLLEDRYSEAERVLLEARVLTSDYQFLFDIDVTLMRVYVDREEYYQAKLLLDNIERSLPGLELHHGFEEDPVLSHRLLEFLYWKHHLSVLQEDYSSALNAIHRTRELIQSINFESVSFSNYINSGYYQDLAIVYGLMGDYDQYITLLSRVSDAEEDILSVQILGGTESQKQALINGLIQPSRIFSSTYLLPENTQAIRLATTTALRRKGRILDSLAVDLDNLRQGLTPYEQERLIELQQVRARLSELMYRRSGELSSSDQIEFQRLQRLHNDLQGFLHGRHRQVVSSFQPVTLEAIQAQIPKNAVLVEWISFTPYNPKVALGDRWGKPRYAAYILHPSGDPQWVDLGDAATIDAAARAFLAATRNPNSGSHARTTARALDELVMAPIRPLVGESTHLLLSPDSQLNLVPFAALVDEQNRYLVETYTLTHLTTGRDLLRLQNLAPSRQPPVILANPNYDTADPSGAQLVAASASPRPQGEGPGERGDQRSTDIADLRFGPLPGTEREVQAIAPQLTNPIVLTEATATENALKQVQGPSILHIATHGFFLEDVEFLPPGNPRGEIELVSAAPGSFATGSNRPTSTENPLLRSGLALAGFNRRDSGGEDGVLTALEAVGLDLRGTRLVVLSACETGVGAATNGEGVYGLRRAFAIAGAESQLMSLWKVDDEGTAELMAQYYELLLAGAGRSEALRQVQLAFLQNGGGQQHPYYWASFMFSGNWHPMPED